MIFPVLEVERVVQVGDKTRLSGVKSFSASTEIQSVKIRPEAGQAFVDVTRFSNRDWHLDWRYTGETRTVEVTIEITGSAGETETAVQKLILLTADDDQLFSNDQDLEAIEPRLLSYVPDGRSSFLNVHREAKNKILQTFHDRGVFTVQGLAVEPKNLMNKDEVRDWARYLTLAMIFNGKTLQPDDLFATKAKLYWAEASARAERAIVTLDLDGDGKADEKPTGYNQISVTRLSR